MIKEKSHDTENLKEDLIEAIMQAAEYGEFTAITAQHYLDDEDGWLWGFSFHENAGIRMFPRLVEEGILNLYRQADSVEREQYLSELLADLIQKSWDVTKTIDVTTTTYQDEYDMYGVRPSDFS